MPLPKSRIKLLKLFEQIEDESIKLIISEVVSLENKHRSSSYRFFMRDIESIIDNEAKLLEIQEQQGIKK